jgi:hypothetical protein
VQFDPGAGDLKPESQDRPSGTGPSLDSIKFQLEKILSSEAFVHSPQLCRFLRFIVEQEIAGQADQLKEYVIGLQVLRKDESFDPRIDTGVRTEARRLRQKLAEYYQTEGRNDPIEITVPKGSYRAVFTTRPEAAAPAVIASSKAAPARGRWIAACMVLTAAVAAGAWLWSRTHATLHVPSIAVIPLENLSADAEQEYFSDGMTDALFTDLAKVHGLSVISRASVMQ